jgi:capsular polysaccharide export protein
MAIVSTRNLPPDCDPWHLVSGAAQAIIDADDELALIAALALIPVQTVGDGVFRTIGRGGSSALCELFRPLVSQTFLSPFGNEALDFAQIVELCGFWRRLIDSNRDITSALGFAFWKQETVAPLLWSGRNVPFAHSPRSPERGDKIAIWKSRTQPTVLAELEQSEVQLIEVEDGFIRSAGLGADCIPPLSIVVDQLGIYFDPDRPSELERILQDGEFSPEILRRARELRELIVELGISKYGAGDVPLPRRKSDKRHLLVAGQVEDDRAVIAGRGPRANLDLLRRVRESNRDTYIIYKPHPDVEAGHRSGGILETECLAFADEIVRKGPISSLIAFVDEVHVNTSLAGFEALLRGKAVITYGVPFYAGWGLTRDLGPIPNRRSTKRNIDELVAAALLLYPRYVDPVTGLPCPPEILIRRIGEKSSDAKPTQLVRLRRLQGKLKRRLALFRSDR